MEFKGVQVDRETPPSSPSRPPAPFEEDALQLSIWTWLTKHKADPKKHRGLTLTVGAVIVVCGVIWSLMFVLIGAHLAIAGPFTFIVVVLPALLHGCRSKSIMTLRTVFTCTLALCPFLVYLAFGGARKASGVLYWSFLAPQAGVTLGESRYFMTKLMFLLSFVITFLQIVDSTFGLEKHLIMWGLTPSQANEPWEGIFTVLNTMGPPLVSYFAILFVLFQLDQEKFSLEAEIVQRKKAEEKALKAKEGQETFIALMSHEIRTPLNGLLGCMELLDVEEMCEDNVKLVSTSRQAGKMILHIVNDILDMAQCNAKEIKLQEAPVDVRFLVSNVTDLFRGKLEGKGVQVGVQVSAMVPDWVITDGARLQQILQNLMSNAAKFTSEGSVHLEVTVGPPQVAQTSSSTVHSMVQANQDTIESYLPTNIDPHAVLLTFTLRDTGIGIPKVSTGSLFDPFSGASAATARKYGGTGLGLSIVRKLTDLMGGSISVDSEQGKGTCFYVQLPFKIPQSDFINRNPTRLLSLDPVSRAVQYGLTILVVDDNSINLTVAKRLLEKLGCTAVLRDSGKKAIKLVAQLSKKCTTPEDAVTPIGMIPEVEVEVDEDLEWLQGIDLILMDCWMPEMDGLEATQVLRSMGLNKPIVAVTADGTSQMQSRIQTSGFTSNILKPINLQKLTLLFEDLGLSSK